MFATRARDPTTPRVQANRTVEAAFGMEIDYASLTKIYGVDPQAGRRYRGPAATGRVTLGVA